MLKHSKQLNIGSYKFLQCIDVLKDPNVLFGKTENLKEIKILDNNLYNIVFKWNKFGREWIFNTTMIILTSKNSIKYISTADSQYKCKFEIKHVNDNKIVLDCEFNVGIIKNLIVKAAMNKDFKRFVEAIGNSIEYMCNTGVDKGIARETDGVSCTSCIFYAKDSSECTILSKPIENYNEPPCGGRYYIRRY